MVRLLAPFSFAALLFLAAGPAVGSDLKIAHRAASCVLAEQYPRLTADVTPEGVAVSARVLFRPETSGPLAPRGSTSAALPSNRDMPSATGDRPAAGALAEGAATETTATGWYSVAMTREGDRFVGVLPRPRLTTQKLRYAIEVTNAAAAAFREGEHVLQVVGNEAACGGGDLTETLAAANVVVKVPPGAPLVPPVPEGFSPVGATAVASDLPVLKQGGGKKGLFIVGGGVAALAGGLVALSPSDKHESAAVIAAEPRVFAIVSQGAGVGASVSLSTMGLTMFLTVKPPADVPEGTLRARLYNMSSPSQTCAAMRARVTNLAANRVNGVVISQFDTAVPCGDVNRMQLSLEDTQGRVIVATGNQEPDLPVSLRLVP